MEVFTLALKSLYNRRLTASLTVFAIAVSVMLLLGVGRISQSAQEGPGPGVIGPYHGRPMRGSHTHQLSHVIPPLLGISGLEFEWSTLQHNDLRPDSAAYHEAWKKTTRMRCMSCRHPDDQRIRGFTANVWDLNYNGAGRSRRVNLASAIM